MAYNMKMKNDSRGNDSGGGKSTSSVGQGTGHGHKSSQKKASMAHSEGRKDPGQASGNMKMKDAKIHREGPSTLADMY